MVELDEETLELLGQTEGDLEEEGLSLLGLVRKGLESRVVFPELDLITLEREGQEDIDDRRGESGVGEEGGDEREQGLEDGRVFQRECLLHYLAQESLAQLAYSL